MQKNLYYIKSNSECFVSFLLFSFFSLLSHSYHILTLHLPKVIKQYKFKLIYCVLFWVIPCRLQWKIPVDLIFLMCIATRYVNGVLHKRNLGIFFSYCRINIVVGPIYFKILNNLGKCDANRIYLGTGYRWYSDNKSHQLFKRKQKQIFNCKTIIDV